MLKKLTLFAGYATGDDRITPFTNYMVQYPFVLALFFLSCWADPKPTHVDIDGKFLDLVKSSMYVNVHCITSYYA